MLEDTNSLDGARIIFQLQVTLIMSAVQVVICMALGVTKVIVGHKLESRALITDSEYRIFTCIFLTLTWTSKSL